MLQLSAYPRAEVEHGRWGDLLRPLNAAEPLVIGAQECRISRSLWTQQGIPSLVLLAPDAAANAPCRVPAQPAFKLVTC